MMTFPSHRARRACAAAGLLWATLLATAPSRADEDGEGADRGAAPRGASGAILVPPPKADAPPPKVSFPVLKRHVDPVYPPMAVKAGIQGDVVLKVTVDSDGRVSKAVVAQGLGHGLDAAAVRAAEQLLFEPARTKPDGKAIRATILFKYTFTLQIDPRSLGPEPATLLCTVVTGSDKTPFAGATVTVELADGSTKELSTDDSGRFDLPELAAGAVTIEVSATGYESITVVEELEEGESLEVRYRLVPMDEAYGGTGVIDVTVKGDRPNREVLRRTIEQRELNRIPGTKGDALRSLENLPGVARPPAFTGLLIVRGSAPQDSITFIDGTAVPLAYHFGGLASVVPTEMIEQIDFYPGNFSSRYGRAMGGVVEVGLKSPRTDGYHGLAQVDFIDARLQLEGPIPWLDGWSFMAAGRRSWLDALLTPVLDAVDEIDVVQSPAYYDYQFMIENRPDPDSRFRLAFYGSDDGFEIIGEDPDEEATGGFDLHMAFMRLQGSYQTKLTGGHEISVMTSLNRDLVDFSIFDSNIGKFFVDVEVLSVSNRLAYSHRVTDWLALNGGLDIVSGEATVTTRLPVKIDDDEEDDEGQPNDAPFVPPEVEEEAYSRTFFRPAGYLEAEITPVRHLRIVPGMRLDYTLRGDHFDVSPRLNASYGLFPGFPQTTIKAAVGLYPQPPEFLKIIGPDAPDDLESNRAIHYGLGLEQDITRQLEVSVEGFVKDLSNLVVDVEGQGAAEDRSVNEGTGYVVGGEVLLKYKPDDRFFGWLAYTLSRSARRDQPDAEEYLIAFDQTHILTVLGSYRLGAGWEVGARFRLVSGNLITPLICNPEDEGCDPGIASVYHAPSASYVRLPGAAKNSERLPLFHQLDLRVDKTWTFESWKFGMYLDILNVYNHMADEGVQYSYDLANREYFGGLPIIPSLGMRGQF